MQPHVAVPPCLLSEPLQMPMSCHCPTQTRLARSAANCIILPSTGAARAHPYARPQPAKPPQAKFVPYAKPAAIRTVPTPLAKPVPTPLAKPVVTPLAKPVVTLAPKPVAARPFRPFALPGKGVAGRGPVVSTPRGRGGYAAMQLRPFTPNIAVPRGVPLVRGMVMAGKGRGKGRR